MRFFHRIHKFIGILIGIPLFISGISGAIYVWQPELTKACYSSLYVDSGGEDEILAEDLIARISETTDKQIHKFYFPERERGSYCIKFREDNNYYFYHPVSGTNLGKLPNRRGWLDTVLKIHTFSYLKNGGVFIAWIAILLVTLLISTGIRLWKPKKRKLLPSDFIVEKRFWKLPQLFIIGHKIAGLYLSVVIVVIAFSGVYFVYKKEYKQLIGKITGEQATAPLPLKNNRAKEPLINIYDALEIADENFNAYVPRSIVLSNNKNTPTYISWMKSRNIDSGKRDRPFAYINPVTKNTTYIYIPADANKTDHFVNGVIPQLHFGEWGGVFSRILNFVASLGLAGLVCTGYYIFFFKLKSRRYR